VFFSARHIRGKENKIADCLSRFQMNRFWALAPGIGSAGSTISLGAIGREARRLLEASLASGSRATYKRGVDSFADFRSSLGLGSEWPASVRHVISYISFLSIEGKAPASHY
jgi:hypothetical protein